MALDFAKAGTLFLGTEQELAQALGIGIGDRRQYRANPQHAPKPLLAKLGQVLSERGAGMKRVGEMLLEDYGE
jgi:hypothetical protein